VLLPDAVQNRKQSELPVFKGTYERHPEKHIAGLGAFEEYPAQLPGEYNK